MWRPYSIRPKIIAIIEFKIYHTKNDNFDLPTTKDKAIFRIFLQKTTDTSSFLTKDEVFL